MANWTVLKAAIAEVIKTNGNKEITGAVLQSTLNTIVSNLGENATFKGVATPTTAPGTPDGNLFYIATQKGIYANFNDINLAPINILYDGIYILKNNGNWELIEIAKTLYNESAEINLFGTFLNKNIDPNHGITDANYAICSPNFYKAKRGILKCSINTLYNAYLVGATNPNDQSTWRRIYNTAGGEKFENESIIYNQHDYIGVVIAKANLTAINPNEKNTSGLKLQYTDTISEDNYKGLINCIPLVVDNPIPQILDIKNTSGNGGNAVLKSNIVTIDGNNCIKGTLSSGTTVGAFGQLSFDVTAIDISNLDEKKMIFKFIFKCSEDLQIGGYLNNGIAFQPFAITNLHNGWKQAFIVIDLQPMYNANVFITSLRFDTYMAISDSNKNADLYISQIEWQFFKSNYKLKPFEKSIRINSFMRKGARLLPNNQNQLIYEEQGEGTLVNMFFAGDYANVQRNYITIETDGNVLFHGYIYELIGLRANVVNPGLKYGISLFGISGSTNGIYLNYKIPFYSHLKIYLRNSEIGAINPYVWFSCRTVKGVNIEIGGIKIPYGAYLYANPLSSTQLPAGEEHTILETRNAVAIVCNIILAVSNTSMWYLEGCLRAYLKEFQTPKLISSGLEDYFLGTYYFNSGLYQNEIAGLTFLDLNTKFEFAAYRTHIVDPLTFDKGGIKLKVRNNDINVEELNYLQNPSPTNYRTICVRYEW